MCPLKRLSEPLLECDTRINLRASLRSAQPAVDEISAHPCISQGLGNMGREPYAPSSEEGEGWGAGSLAVC